MAGPVRRFDGQAQFDYYVGDPPNYDNPISSSIYQSSTKLNLIIMLVILQITTTLFLAVFIKALHGHFLRRILFLK